MSSLSRIARMLHHRTSSLSKGDPIALPISTSSTFALPDDPDGHLHYGRDDNLTVAAVEHEIGILEDAEIVLFPSGMAAIASIFASFLDPGDTILIHSDGYYNARALLDEFVTRHGINVRLCATKSMAEADMTGCRMVLIETPCNPGLDVCDIATIAARTKAAGALLVADNTTASPLGQLPLDLGADIVVVSDTKSMAGHSDILCGHVASRSSEHVGRIRRYRRLSGAILSPFDAFLLHRGLATLEVRLARSCTNALAVANALLEHETVRAVRYPGLTSDPAFEIATRQMWSFGPVLNFTLRDRAQAEAFIADCPFIVPATSFGGVHTSAERRIRWGDAVPEGFVRLSCGIEPTDILVSGILQTLDQVNNT